MINQNLQPTFHYIVKVKRLESNFNNYLQKMFAKFYEWSLHPPAPPPQFPRCLSRRRLMFINYPSLEMHEIPQDVPYGRDGNS